MSNLPFAISEEAATSIEKDLDLIDGDTRFAGLCPVLSVALNYQLIVKGRVAEAFEGEHFHIGIQDPTIIGGGKYTELRIGTRKVWMHEDQLAELIGKRLVLEKVDVGVPRPADKTALLLRAVEFR